LPNIFISEKKEINKNTSYLVELGLGGGAKRMELELPQDLLFALRDNPVPVALRISR